MKKRGWRAGEAKGWRWCEKVVGACGAEERGREGVLSWHGRADHGRLKIIVWGT